MCQLSKNLSKQLSVREIGGFGVVVSICVCMKVLDRMVLSLVEEVKVSQHDKLKFKLWIKRYTNVMHNTIRLNIYG